MLLTAVAQIRTRTLPGLALALTIHAATAVVLPRLATAATAPDCRPQAAAGKEPPPAVAQGSRQAFKIFWHVGTEMEALAEADRSASTRAEIDRVRKNVDGYYITVQPHQLGFWPGRPPECALNFMRARNRLGKEQVAELRQNCQRRFLASIESQGADPQEVYLDALRRTLDALNVKRDQADGKPVIGQMLLARRDFARDAAGQLTLRTLPTTFCYLNAAGISVNNVMAYQEPSVQREAGNLFAPNTTPGGPAPRSALPYNLEILDTVADAFARAGIPLTRFSVDVRLWNESMIKALQSADRKHLGGVFFEGGTGTISAKGKPGRIDNFAEGMAWLLANTDYKIFVLMPGFWERQEVKSDEDFDDIIPRLQQMIVLLDQKIAGRMGSDKPQHPICNARIHLIPANYGNPVHVPPLPPERNGHEAGTVTGQIMLLAKLRHALCGAPQ
jgi:hypothetical protein